MADARVDEGVVGRAGWRRRGGRIRRRRPPPSGTPSRRRRRACASPFPRSGIAGRTKRAARGGSGASVSPKPACAKARRDVACTQTGGRPRDARPPCHRELCSRAGHGARRRASGRRGRVRRASSRRQAMRSRRSRATSARSRCRRSCRRPAAVGRGVSIPFEDALATWAGSGDLVHVAGGGLAAPASRGRGLVASSPGRRPGTRGARRAATAVSPAGMAGAATASAHVTAQDAKREGDKAGETRAVEHAWPPGDHWIPRWAAGAGSDDRTRMGGRRSPPQAPSRSRGTSRRRLVGAERGGTQRQPRSDAAGESRSARETGAGSNMVRGPRR